jgi:hypothetical protein
VGGAKEVQQHLGRDHAALRLYLLPCMAGPCWNCQFCLLSASPRLTLLWNGISTSLSACSTAVTAHLTPSLPTVPSSCLLAGNTSLLLRQVNGTVPRQRLIPDFSAIEAPAGVCRCAATGSVFTVACKGLSGGRAQGSGRPGHPFWPPQSP